jgi:hypothetical protein
VNLFDANTFMESMRTYYPIDMVPAYWEWLKKAHESGDLASIKAVYEEIVDGKKEDDLVRWARSMPSSFWLPTRMSRLLP